MAARQYASMRASSSSERVAVVGVSGLTGLTGPIVRALGELPAEAGQSCPRARAS
ncbi:hypothetical protein I547_5578 [Mycobacterium kansasii 824]|nr:hypothetical protein I547_5578 [Mycobacterium kansasii 824]